MYKFFTFIFILSSFFNIHTKTPMHALFQGKEWEFLEYHFIEKPNRVYRLRKPMIYVGNMVAITATAFGLDYYIKTNIPKFNAKRSFKPQLFARTLLNPLLILGALLINHRYSGLIMERIFLYNTAKRFVQKWPQHKAVTPLEFHEIFEMLHELYTKSGETKKFKKKLSKIVTIIRESIFKHFPEKYTSNNNNTWYIKAQQKPLLQRILYKSADILSEKVDTIYRFFN